ncbi:ExbD/TolR family protein [Roseibium aggregatum]|uniref:Biopolymer transporter ExbD n=1 Tax=Roseibium aggregatum TaxID=187304 RepID=A0A939ECT0_9HYPH|nr:biopolymer transporter ExbD [Roseibium aggregatum]MBN9670386.1 biopolymer transporter ExbD [Roseibium aggregatum]
MKRYTKPIHLPKTMPQRSDNSALALINVAFLLLLFLLVAGTLRPPLPEDFAWAETSTGSGQGDIQNGLVLTKTGDLWFEGRLLSVEETEDLLKAIAANAERVSVQVDKRAEMAAVAGLADRLRGHGVKELSLVTIEADGP